MCGTRGSSCVSLSSVLCLLLFLSPAASGFWPVWALWLSGGLLDACVCREALLVADVPFGLWSRVASGRRPVAQPGQRTGDGPMEMSEEAGDLLRDEDRRP